MIDTIAQIVTDARKRNPEARFAVCVVPGKRWPDTRLGQRVRIAGRLCARYIGDSPHGALVDLYLADADAWLAQQRARATS